MRKPSVMWSVSLLVISMITLVTAISNILGAKLPQGVKIPLGVIDCIALFFLIHSSIKSKKPKHQNQI